MKKLLEKFITWWRWQMLSPEEKYLMKSSDVIDLERRQREIWSYKKGL